LEKEVGGKSGKWGVVKALEVKKLTGTFDYS
jgi:hypothetical protein